jgi:hypothetical protein
MHCHTFGKGGGVSGKQDVAQIMHAMHALGVCVENKFATGLLPFLRLTKLA